MNDWPISAADVLDARRRIRPYLSPTPLNAEDIADALSVARSNVSTSLRELQGWGIVKIVHVLGDRRDHFESVKDVWELFRTIVESCLSKLSA